MSSKLLVALLGATLTLGCEPAGGPAHDDDKTPTQVAEEAKQSDTAALEEAKASYESAIAATTEELQALEKQITDAGSSALDNLMTDAGAQADKLQADLASWKAEAGQLTKTLDDLKAKLTAVTKELAARAAGGETGNG